MRSWYRSPEGFQGRRSFTGWVTKAEPAGCSSNTAGSDTGPRAQVSAPTSLGSCSVTATKTHTAKTLKENRSPVKSRRRKSVQRSQNRREHTAAAAGTSRMASPPVEETACWFTKQAQSCLLLQGSPRAHSRHPHKFSAREWHQVSGPTAQVTTSGSKQAKTLPSLTTKPNHHILRL